MKVWHLDFKVNDYVNLWSAVKIDIETQRTFDGRSQINNWKPVRAVMVHPGDARPLPNVTDFGSFIPIFDAKALDALMVLMKDAVELLPIEYEGATWFGINVTKVLDAIDHEKAEPVRLSTGKIIRFEKYAFKPEVIQGHNIFKITDKKLFCEFVSDEFKNLAEEAGLVGFNFQLVWDSANA